MFDLENEKILVTQKTIKASETLIREYYVSCNFRLCMINSGNGIWQIGDGLYTIKAGDVVILDNRQKRAFIEAPEDGIGLTIIDFEPQFVINTPFAGLFFRNDSYNCVISEHMEINRLVKELEHESTSKLINHHLIVGAKLIEILALIGRFFNINTDNYNINEDMCRALDYIRSNYTSDISLSSIATLLHMSPTTFSKRFSQSMKITFSEYVMQKRIHHAIHLLEKTNKTVLDISLESGFNNMANFYKAFKKVATNTPNYYRNAYLRNNV